MRRASTWVFSDAHCTNSLILLHSSVLAWVLPGLLLGYCTVVDAPIADQMPLLVALVQAGSRVNKVRLLQPGEGSGSVLLNSVRRMQYQSTLTPLHQCCTWPSPPAVCWANSVFTETAGDALIFTSWLSTPIIYAIWAVLVRAGEGLVLIFRIVSFLMICDMLNPGLIRFQGMCRKQRVHFWLGFIETCLFCTIV